MDTLDVTKVTEKIVSDRLEKVAVQLEKVAKKPEATEMELEDELLNADTPAPSTPAEPAVPNTIVPPTGEESDPLGQRVQQIFGKRPANDSIGSDSSPKVANTTVSGSDDAVKTSVANIDVAESSKGSSGDDIAPAIVKASDGDDSSKSSMTNPPPQIPPPADPPHDVPMEENNEQEDGNQAENGGDGDGGWVEQDDQPQAFPDVGFPMQVPSYPRQPDFRYRYRTPNSTPRGRRIDAQRSIVLRRCERDRHTGRFSQEDYEAREDAEMALSLG